ncbi:MAG: Lipoprotein YhcN precursor [Firmicutes bacterium ADurb.Bin456]|nr:MAG: Lipoprotein YhcN precursor [Firmicutes bacterium ADurb.Bin456]
MKRIEKLAVLAIILLIGMLTVTGCNALRKPVPENTPEAQVPAPSETSREPMPTDSKEVDKIAKELARAADQVPGVNGATVVLAGTTAFVGVDQKAGLEEKETERVKRDVSNKVKEAEPRLTAVHVSSDPDTVTRLREIAKGVANGEPVSAFDQELAEIVKRISPTAK